MPYFTLEDVYPRTYRFKNLRTFSYICGKRITSLTPVWRVVTQRIPNSLNTNFLHRSFVRFAISMANSMKRKWNHSCLATTLLLNPSISLKAPRMGTTWKNVGDVLLCRICLCGYTAGNILICWICNSLDRFVVVRKFSNRTGIRSTGGLIRS